jgi:hypothetical protein
MVQSGSHSVVHIVRDQSRVESFIFCDKVVSYDLLRHSNMENTDTGS